jgi:hypothetical protein
MVTPNSEIPPNAENAGGEARRDESGATSAAPAPLRLIEIDRHV